MVEQKDFPTAPATLSNDGIALWDQLSKRIITLNERAWGLRITGPEVMAWLRNFTGLTGRDQATEQLHALFILSQFMYFGSREIRVLLRAMYRDLFFIPLVQQIREKLGPGADSELRSVLEAELAATRFMGVGNPSESGVHLLYFFRQENGLSSKSFMDSAQLFVRVDENGAMGRRLRHPEVRRYVFLDDLCGSGETAVRYSKDLLPDVLAQAPETELCYLSLFATSRGLDVIDQQTVFGGHADSVFILDDSYQVFCDRSRYMAVMPDAIDAALLRSLASSYGALLVPEHPLGYGDSQLLLGFSHNTPDNTLPIIWADRMTGARRWVPVFRRYQKF
jgi:hypothetical protein